MHIRSHWRVAASIFGLLHVGQLRVYAQSIPRSDAKAAIPRLDWQITPKGDDWDLTTVVGMALDKFGRLYVLDGGDNTIRAYTPSGGRLKRLGRKGTGPGELEHPSFLQVRRDSIWIIERSSGRVTAFSIASGRARTMQLLPSIREQNSPIAVITGGFLVAVQETNAFGAGSGQRNPFGAGSTRVAYRYVMVDANGSPGKTLARHEYPVSLTFKTHRVGSSGGGGQMHREQPFFAYSYLAVAMDGSFMIDVVPTQPSAQSNQTLMLVAMSNVGETLWKRQLQAEAVSVTRSHVSAMIDSFAKPTVLVPGMRIEGDRRMIADSMYRAAVWPVVRGALIGIDGTIWLKQGGPPTRGDIYWRLSPTGLFERAVQLPLGFSLQQASRTQLWGWRLDSDDLPIVERYSYR